MDSRNDPNVDFRQDAEAFLESQDIVCRAEAIAVASWLYGSPEIDGVSKFFQPVYFAFGVRIYQRVYRDDKITVVYELDGDADPPLLIVWDIFPTPKTA